MTQIYEIVLFSSVKINANFDALHYGKNIQPCLTRSIGNFIAQDVFYGATATESKIYFRFMFPADSAPTLFSLFWRGL